MKGVTPNVSKLRVLCMVATTAVIALGCAPDEFDDFEEFDAVLTVRDADYDFSPNKTYAMPDVILDIAEDVDNVIERDTDNDEAILEQVADEMEAFGYERIDDLDDPNVDVFVAVGGVTQENVAWGSYYSYTDPWGGYYWYYPVSTVVVTYPVGSIVIHLVDADEVDTALEEQTPVWVAGLRGLANGRSESAVQKLVTQAFTQSPYLNVSSSTNAVLGGEL